MNRLILLKFLGITITKIELSMILIQENPVTSLLLQQKMQHQGAFLHSGHQWLTFTDLKLPLTNTLQMINVLIPL
jgi:hypothetical protein